MKIGLVQCDYYKIILHEINLENEILFPNYTLRIRWENHLEAIYFLFHDFHFFDLISNEQIFPMNKQKKTIFNLCIEGKTMILSSDFWVALSTVSWLI